MGYSVPRNEGVILKKYTVSFLSVLALTMISLSHASSEAAQTKARPGSGVIYGQDDRLEIYQVSDRKILAVADSTVALFEKGQLVPGKAQLRGSNRQVNTLALRANTFGAAYHLCQQEPFFNQPSGAFCSGFLVGPDLVATAGHCVEDSKCPQVAFAFGFQMNNNNTPIMTFPQTEVYGCKKVIARELTNQQDYALVQLDRPVTNHKPLALAQRAPAANEPIYVIGHPAGLPKKAAGGANVRNLSNGFFSANTDTYGGNSGSAVFSLQTHEVLGILVRGENDFVQTANQCQMSNVCATDQCRGEDITFIQYISKAMGNRGVRR